MVKKGIYVDGHEQSDVVDYCTEFLSTIAQDEHLQVIYGDQDLNPIQPSLHPSKKKHVPIHHDKSIFRSNELQQKVWVKDGKMPLRKKGNRKAIHVSDFITEEMGHLSLTEEQVSQFLLSCP